MTFLTLLARCVVGVNGSAGSEVAFRWAVAQAAASGSAGEVVAVHGFLPSAELFAAGAQVDLGPSRDEHRRLLEHEWTAAARGTGVTVRTEIVEDAPAAALLTTADRHGGLPIVVGHQGHGRRAEHHVGHVAGQLLRRSQGPVILTSASSQNEAVQGIVVVCVYGATDPSHPSVAWGATFAEQRGLALHLLSVTAPPAVGPGYGYPRAAYEVDVAAVRAANRDATAALVADLMADHSSVAVSSEVLFGHPTDVLAEAISDLDAAVVVLGSHHPSALVSFFADGVARYLPARLDCPVVVVPAA